MDLMEIGYEGVVWVHLAEGRNQWRALNEHDIQPCDSIKDG
jgi:hypothetical protein